MDYDPDLTRADAAGCPPLRGLLLEPAIRNQLLWSSDLLAACWFDAHRLRRDPEPTVAGPDAQIGDVISITDLSGHDWHHIGQWFPCRGSGRLTASIFVKATAEGSADFSIYAYGGHNLATFRRGDWAPIAGIAERTVVEKFRDGLVRVTAVYRALDHIYFGCAVGAAGSYEGRDEKQFYLYGPSLTAGAEPVSYVPTASAPATKACDVITLEDGAIAVPQVPVHVRRPKDIFEREELFDIIRPGRLIERLAAWMPLLKWTMDRLFEDADKIYAAADFEAELETYEKLVNLCVQIGEGSLVSEAAVRMARLKRNTHPESAVRRLVALKRTLLEMSLKLGGSGETKRALGILLASAPLNDYAAAAPVLEMVYGEGARDIAIIDVLSRAYLGTAITMRR